MILLIDAGNTRIKWELREQGLCVGGGSVPLAELDSGNWRIAGAQKVRSVAVSAVISEERRRLLEQSLQSAVGQPGVFYWAEPLRDGLVNAYSDCARMGADRWHAMYGAWRECRDGFAVIDAGSALTVDYVRSDGAHLGGYILPGKEMMLRSLKTDAARIGFDPADQINREPGIDTGQCVIHGQSWLWSAVTDQIFSDVRRYGLSHVFVTGGDAGLFDRPASGCLYRPSLVLDGLAAIHQQEAAL